MPFDATPQTKHDLNTYAGRLRHLADFIERLPDDLVKLEYYFDDPDQQENCNTAACALGWAARMPEFQALGLKTQYGLSIAGGRVFFGHKPGETDMKRVKYCFGGGGQFSYLSRSYTPQDVARHLRETADDMETENAL